MSYARITVSGNLGQDAETKYTPNGAMVVNFSIAVNNSRDKDAPATWYRVAAWGDLAERLTALAQKGYLNKGAGLVVFGRFAPREYAANGGEVKISFDVTADSFEFVGAKRDDANGSNTQQQRPTTNEAPPQDFGNVPF